MMQHHQRNRPWRWALVVGAAGLLLGHSTRAQVAPPAKLTPLKSFAISGKASGSETTQTSAADYTIKFTLAPDRVLDPTTAALRLRLETDAEAPEPCGEVVIPEDCFFPDGAGSFAVSDNCRVSVKEFKDELGYARDLTPLLQNFSATLQQVQGEWQARLVMALSEDVEQPEPCSITFSVSTHGVENMPISSSDARFRAAQ